MKKVLFFLFKSGHAGHNLKLPTSLRTNMLHLLRYLLFRSVDDRYTAIVEAAKTRSVLALGVSCWRVTRDEPEPEYYVQTYNILLLSRDNFTVEPGIFSRAS